MKGIETEGSVAEALRFLSTCIAKEARQDSVDLTDAELQQLSFSEETATADEIAAAARTWRQHLAALQDHDVYVLVMVDRAGIPRPRLAWNHTAAVQTQ